jgi:hypothetical protein
MLAKQTAISARSLRYLSKWVTVAVWRKSDAQPGSWPGCPGVRGGALAEWTVSASLGWQQLEQDAKRDRESTAAAKDRARLGELCLRLS